MKRALSTILAAVICAVCLAGCSAAGYTVFNETAAFSDDIMFSAKIAGGRASYAHARMTEIIAAVNADVSYTDKNSSIYRFNAAPADTDVEVGKYCYELFALSREYCELTGGAFNPAMAPLVELWHLDASSIATYRPQPGGGYVSPALPTHEEVAEALDYCDLSLVTAAVRDGRYYLKKSDARVKLDFGGIAKGYAVDLCVRALGEYDVPSALLDISGNAYFYGDHIADGDKSDWHVGIADPRPRAGETVSRGYVCAVTVSGNSSAVTSGDYMRYYIHDNADGSKVYVPHIIGRDGAPIGVVKSGDGWANAPEYVISATVIGKNSALCDALSTAAAVCGLEGGATLLQKVGYKGLLFTEKKFTIINGAELYDPDTYDGYKAYERTAP